MDTDRSNERWSSACILWCVCVCICIYTNDSFASGTRVDPNARCCDSESDEWRYGPVGPVSGASKREEERGRERVKKKKRAKRERVKEGEREKEREGREREREGRERERGQREREGRERERAERERERFCISQSKLHVFTVRI
jgi:hypothetical protein